MLKVLLDMFAPVASFLGSLSSFFKNFDAFRSALQPVQALASPRRNQHPFWQQTCCAKGQTASTTNTFGQDGRQTHSSEPFSVKYSVHDHSKAGIKPPAFSQIEQNACSSSSCIQCSALQAELLPIIPNIFCLVPNIFCLVPNIFCDVALRLCYTTAYRRR